MMTAKRKIIAIILIGIILVFNGCTNSKFDNSNVENSRKAIYEFYRWHFVTVPEEYISFNEELSSASRLVFQIYWDPVKTYPNIHDEVDNVDVVDETLYVEYSQGVYKVYTVLGENIFVYTDRGINLETNQSNQS